MYWDIFSSASYLAKHITLLQLNFFLRFSFAFVYVVALFSRMAILYFCCCSTLITQLNVYVVFTRYKIVGCFGGRTWCILLTLYVKLHVLYCYYCFQALHWRRLAALFRLEDQPWKYYYCLPHQCIGDLFIYWCKLVYVVIYNFAGDRSYKQYLLQ